MHHIYVHITRDLHGYPPVDVEELDASRVGPDVWRLEAAPTFLQGVAQGDVLGVAKSADGTLWATEVVSTAGNWCARVIPLGGATGESVVDQFIAIRCPARPTKYGLVVIEPPASVSVKLVKSVLEAGRAEGRWDFELGVVPDGWSEPVT